MNLLYLGLGAFLLFIGGKKAMAQVSDKDNFSKYDALFEKYGKKYNVPILWLKAIAMNESLLGKIESVAHGLLNPTDIEKSKSSDGLSWGLMQVTIKTAQSLDPTATPSKLNNAEYSIDLAAKYIGTDLMPRFSKTDPRYDEWVIKSYNQGPGNTGKERAGSITGYAQEYWERFKRNLQKAKESMS